MEEEFGVLAPLVRPRDGRLRHHVSKSYYLSTLAMWLASQDGCIVVKEDLVQHERGETHHVLLRGFCFESQNGSSLYMIYVSCCSELSILRRRSRRTASSVSIAAGQFEGADRPRGERSVSRLAVLQTFHQLVGVACVLCEGLSVAYSGVVWRGMGGANPSGLGSSVGGLGRC